VRIFVFLHVATMFTAVAASIGPAYLLSRIAHTGDVPTIRRVFALAQPLGNAIGPLFGLGALLGIVSIFTNGLNPFLPFLLIAYVMFALVFITGIAINGPWQRRVTALAAESPDSSPSAELTAALNDPRMKWIEWFDRLMIVAFVFDMIVKPFT
jgi:hypothetical protein